jgi:hypothetical protein
MPLVVLKNAAGHAAFMRISKASSAGAIVELSRTEVLAISNLLLYAPHVPLEVRGPGEIFVGLSAEFEALRAAVSDET